MPALRVPCDARMNRRDVKLASLKQSHPEYSASSVLLGEPERGRLKIKDEGLKTKDQRLKSKHYHLCHSGIVLA